MCAAVSLGCGGGERTGAGLYDYALLLLHPLFRPDFSATDAPASAVIVIVSPLSWSPSIPPPITQPFPRESTATCRGPRPSSRDQTRLLLISSRIHHRSARTQLTTDNYLFTYILYNICVCMECWKLERVVFCNIIIISI